MIDDTLHQKVKNRESIEVNLLEDTSVGGFEITPFATPQMILGAVDIDQDATWGRNTPRTTNDLNHYVPMDLQGSDFV